MDETSFLKATRLAPTQWVTGLVDLERGRLLDVVADRTRAAVDAWLGARPRDWLAQVGTVALDPWRGYASALVTPLGHARVVVDHFHAIRLANTAVDQVRWRVQQATLGHRGRKRDPLYRIRKLLLTAAEQLTGRGRARLRAGLTAGDPTGEVAAAWQGKELLRAIYASDGRTAARAALERFYRWVDGVGVAEPSRLARTVEAWEAEILAWHATGGCSNGPTEAINLLIKSAWNGRLESASLVGHPRRTAGGATTAKEPAAMARTPHPGPIHLGLDVHRDTISVATLPPDRATAEVERIPSDEAAVLAFVGRFAEPESLRVCYEAGPTGYELARLLHSHGIACQVIAPSLIPRAAGDKVKTDRRDSRRLARLHRAGELVAIRIPEPHEEAVRDLCRARADLDG